MLQLFVVVFASQRHEHEPVLAERGRRDDGGGGALPAVGRGSRWKEEERERRKGTDEEVRTCRDSEKKSIESLKTGLNSDRSARPDPTHLLAEGQGTKSLPRYAQETGRARGSEAAGGGRRW